MEQSDHDAFVKAQDYSNWLLNNMKEPLDECELAYLLYLVEHGHLSTSAEEETDG